MESCTWEGNDLLQRSKTVVYYGKAFFFFNHYDVILYWLSASFRQRQ